MGGWRRPTFLDISLRCSTECLQAAVVVALVAALLTHALPAVAHRQPAAAERDIGAVRTAKPLAGVEIRAADHAAGRRRTIRSGAPISTAIEHAATEKVESRFPAGIGGTPVAKDFDASVRFRTIGGREQAAVALRLTTPEDYDLVQVDAYRGTVAFFRVTNGMAAEIVTVEADVFGRDWQTLRIRAEGKQLTIWLAHAWLFTAYDHSVPAAGHISPWTTPESQTRFEGLEVTPVPTPDGR